jgi:hypothetical protein
MKPALIICIFPFMSLLSCTAPTGQRRNSANPVHTGGRFVFGDGHKNPAVEVQNAPNQAASSAKPDASATPETQTKSWFSFLQKKDPPKALAAEQTRPAVKTARKSSSSGDLPRNPSGDFSNNGLRLPDMLTMPDKGEFQSVTPTTPKTGVGPGAVTVRPPTDPPSRPKTKESSEEPK